MHSGKASKKLTLVALFFICAYIAVIVRLFFIQCLRTSSITQEYVRSKQTLPERGKIFDINGQPFVINTTTYLLFAEPKNIKDYEVATSKLHTILSVEEASISARLRVKGDWIPVQRGVTEAQRSKIANLKLAGFGFEEERKRFYPESSLSAHVLGFVGKTEKGNNIGYFGIEGFYEKDLAGLSGITSSERDLNNSPILFGVQDSIQAENGRDLYLTIDKAVEKIAKRRLQDAVERFQAKDGCVLIADPYTMEMKALVCLPDFDPDIYYKFSEDYYMNPSISSLYEPGSTFKPLVVAAAIEEKAIKADDTYKETGPISIGEYTIRTWNNSYEGTISITRILEKSSNVGMVHIGEKLGNKNLFTYIQRYGFGKKTNIDLQGETGGSLKEEKDWYPIDYATATFGQGIAVTPLQMIRAFSTVVNGGKLMVPHMVKYMASDTKRQEILPETETRVLSERTSEVLKKMLQSTVENGEIKWAKPKGYSVGGKTGTAQIPVKGSYDPTKTIASFIGFAPVEKPQFIMLVYLREPKASQWGSETAAPVFFEITKDLIVYYNMHPDQ